MSPYLEKSDWWLHANTMTDELPRRISSYETHRKLFNEWFFGMFFRSCSPEFPSRLKLAGFENGRLSNNHRTMFRRTIEFAQLINNTTAPTIEPAQLTNNITAALSGSHRNTVENKLFDCKWS